MTKLVVVQNDLLNIDLDRLTSDYERVISMVPLKTSARGPDTLRSISFTHRKNAKEPLYDGNNSQFNLETGERLYEEADFSVFNDLFKSTIFFEVYQSVPFRVGRMRLMSLMPRVVYNVHIDSSRRAHIPIITNDHCYMVLEDSMYHLAAGRLYEVDTTIPHTAFNAGKTERVHLVMSIIDEAQV